VTAAYDPVYHKRWRVERARGMKRTTSPARAEAHVRALVAAGMSLRGIADASGTTPTVISHLNRGMKTRLTVRVEEKILAARAADVFNRPNRDGFVPNIGARRRVQALLAIGWRHTDLTPLAGFNTGTMNHQAGDWISRTKHDAMKRVYDQLWNQPGPAGASGRARVVKAGYAPPLAWDDDTIDDPTAIPAGIVDANKTAGRIEDIEFLITTGTSWDEIGPRLGLTEDAAEKFLYRAGRQDLIKKAKQLASEFRRAS